MHFAEKLGISRGTLREAIRMLIQDGLLIQDKRSVNLFKPTLDEIKDIFQCREYLELLAVRLASENTTDSLKEKLSITIENHREAYNRKSTKDISVHDQEFHDLIIFGSQNKELINLMKKIQLKISNIRNYITKLDFADEHESTFQAIVTNDITKAQQEMQNHIENNLNYILQTNKNR